MCTRSILFLVLLLSAGMTDVSAQRLFVNTSRELIKLDLRNSGCNYTTIPTCFNSSFSLALNGDTLYYNRGNQLSRAILRNNEFVDCTALDTIPRDVNALTVDASGLLYYTGGEALNQLYKMDPWTRQKTNVGAMPYISAGDMVFYNNDLYMASTAGLVNVDIADPSKSKLLIPYADSNMYGLAVIATDCDKNGLFALVAKANSTIMVEIDLVNNVLSNIICDLPLALLDASSLVENGSFAGIIIEKITTAPNCDRPGTGYTQVHCEPGLVPYTFTLNNSIQNNTGLFTDLTEGTYQLRITTPGGCVKDTTFTVPSYGDPTVRFQKFSEDASCSKPGQAWFVPQPFSDDYLVTYRNNTFPISYRFRDLPFGEHQFTITTKYGCLLDYATVRFSPDSYCDTVYFPTAFTPNNDGRNDIYKGSYSWVLKKFHFQVFNRWGQLVFSTTNQSTGWNGLVNNRPQPTGVYVWTVSYETSQGRLKSQKGTFVLIR